MSDFSDNQIDHLKAFEAEIRADERAKCTSEQLRLVAHVQDFAQMIHDIYSSTDTPAKAPKSPAAARKTRKAVSATAEEMEEVLGALTELQRQHVGRYFSIKELRGAVLLGTKTVGTALRSLEEGGVLVEKSRKYCLAAVEQSNGAGLDADNPPF